MTGFWAGLLLALCWLPAGIAVRVVGLVVGFGRRSLIDDVQPVRRERASATPPRATPISPTTRATMAPSRPEPVPMAPVLVARCSPARAMPIGPTTRAAMAP